MKKAISLLLSLATVFGMSTLGACATTTGGNNNVVVDDKTINVRLYKAGYGDTFLYKFKEKFEEVYAPKVDIPNTVAKDNNKEIAFFMQSLLKNSYFFDNIVNQYYTI